MTSHTETHSHIAPRDVHSTLSRHMLADGFDMVLDLQASHGTTLVDAATGREYLDFFTFFGSNPIGLNHPKLNNPEFIEKIGRVAINKPSNSDVYTVEKAEFVDTFFRVAVPEHFRYSFYVEGGALAVENALKAAFDWKVRKNLAQGIEGERGQRVLHFRQAFHGRSGYTMSLTNTDPTKVALFPKFEGWPRVSNPMATFPLEGENLAATIEREKVSIAEIEAAFEQYPDEIACIIIEPIQAEGGDNHFRPEFLRELRRICDEREALLIFDEVQTGIGLTGSMWAHEALGVIPDIVSFGKKTQVCGILAGPRIDEVPDNVFKLSSRINSTWGGNLVDMVRFTRILEVIEEEGLVENAATIGAYLLEQIRSLQEWHPLTISNARGRGLLCAFDFPDTATRDSFRKECYDRGLIILGCGSHSIRFRPPLNLTRAEVDRGMAIIRQVVELLAPRRDV